MKRNWNIKEGPVNHPKSGMPEKSSHTDRLDPHEIEVAQASHLGRLLMEVKGIDKISA